jgi:hypothetical protein
VRHDVVGIACDRVPRNGRGNYGNCAHHQFGGFGL